ncbi:ABC transporter substrate-binding protein [Egbenema bharatensis]|uniref:ABC transporter substrate-binding protein n=1 Tax=Egbenema bharatensis TaxID=3463334 RepID=UPI003A83E2E4
MMGFLSQLFQVSGLSRRSRAAVLGLVWIGMLAIGLGGCNPSQFRTQAAQVPQLVTATQSDPSTFNYPLNTSLYTNAVLGLLYTGLLTTNGITGDLEPALAESWEISPDSQRIVFTLREGLQWSDGEPLTAEDVVFTFQDVYLNEDIPTGTRDILRIGDTGSFPSVRQIDDRRVEFTTPEPFAPFLRYSGGIPILPAHILRETIETRDPNGNLRFLTTWGTDADPQSVVGNGLYRMESYTPGQRVVMVRNPYYWREDEQGNPQPYIERIILQIISSADSQLISFRSGDLDEISVEPEQFQLLKLSENQGNYTIYNGGPQSGSRFIGFNLNKASTEAGRPFVDPIKSRWFNTLEFRQAVAHALNRERMRDTIYQGLGELQNSPLDSQNPFYLPPERGLPVYEYDPDRARQLLESAGFEYDALGRLQDWDGNPVRFTLLVRSEDVARVRVATQTRQDLEAIGIRVDVQTLSFNSVIQKLQARDWECYVGGFGGGGLEPHSGYNIWSSQGSLHQFNQGPVPGEPPIVGWEVTDWEREIDRLFTEGVQELDEERRKEIYGRFQQIVQEQLPFIHLVNPLSLNAVRDRVEGIQFTALGGAFWNLYELRVEQE